MKQSEIDAIKDMHLRQNDKCFACTNKSVQRSHIIGDTKPNRKRYGKAVVDNPKNWLGACGLTCNALIDLGKNDLLMSIVAGLIKSIAQDSRAEIEGIVRENIERKRGKGNGK